MCSLTLSGLHLTYFYYDNSHMILHIDQRYLQLKGLIGEFHWNVTTFIAVLRLAKRMGQITHSQVFINVSKLVYGHGVTCHCWSIWGFNKNKAWCFTNTDKQEVIQLRNSAIVFVIANLYVASLPNDNSIRVFHG